MAKPFDAATKYLIESRPADWLALAGLPAEGARVVDADVSTITSATDKVIRVDGPAPYIAHVEFQSRSDPQLDRRVMTYNVLLRWRHDPLPVRSVAFLLRPQARGPGVLGRVSDRGGPGHRLAFRYHLVRVWEQSPEALLAGGLGTLPLAAIGATTEERLPEVIERVRRRLESESPPADARELWAATGILMGLRYQKELIRQLLRQTMHLEDSSFYHMILEEGVEKGIARGRAEGLAEGRAEGRAEVAKALLLRLGNRRLGPPAPPILAALEQIGDIDRLERLVERVLDVNRWEDLLAGA